ncbi:guanylate kinase [Algicola sagamiensis]|uniref:guanylate kinase n=1 Tax=Algicola sagamiensis TaxID=163869 RepID=UPI00037C890C|nr:guanylate kinase [Algicola sagamiensis]
MQARGNLFVLSAPSGAGKSSLIKALLERYQDIALSVSHTTRASREGEVDGTHYHFVDQTQFQQLVDDDNMYEWAQVFGNFYGTSKKAIDDQRNNGLDVFLDIDWQGARQVREKDQTAITIFILPPSVEELRRRLNSRGQDSEEVIEGRMNEAQSEISHYNEFDFILVNDDFEETLTQLEQIIFAHRQSRDYQIEKYGEMIKQLLANQ